MRLLLMLAAAAALLQAPAKPSFEVAAIKPSTPGVRESMSNQPGRFAANNLTLRQLIGFAYGLRDVLLEGGPSWIAEAQWTIEAKAEDGAAPETVPLRLQSLLESRFGLKLHRETREAPVYELHVGKGGSKLKAVDAPPPPVPGQAPPPQARPALRPDGTLPPDFMPRPGAMMAGPGTMWAAAVPMSQIANFLRGQLGRPVIDKTGLNGFYDVRLQFVPPATQDAPGDIPGASIFTAVQEQLGLRLEAAKGPIPVVIIDSAQKPADN